MSSEQHCVRCARVCPWTECQRMWHSVDTPSGLKHSLLEGGERLRKLASLEKLRDVKIHKGPAISLWKQNRKQLLRERRLFHEGDGHLCGKPPGCNFCESSLFLGWWWSSLWVTHGPVCDHPSLFLQVTPVNQARLRWDRFCVLSLWLYLGWIDAC